MAFSKQDVRSQCCLLPTPRESTGAPKIPRARELGKSPSAPAPSLRRRCQPLVDALNGSQVPGEKTKGQAV